MLHHLTVREGLEKSNLLSASGKIPFEDRPTVARKAT
jgi:hypothetical protein